MCGSSEMVLEELSAFKINRVSIKAENMTFEANPQILFCSRNTAEGFQGKPKNLL